jgi:hypothetical protein
MCGRFTNALWKQCGHCAYRNATCSACLASVDADRRTAALAIHERQLDGQCDEL